MVLHRAPEVVRQSKCFCEEGDNELQEYEGKRD